MPGLDDLTNVTIRGRQWGAYHEDGVFVEGIAGTVPREELLQYILDQLEGISVGPGRARYVQQIEGQATTIIIVTANGGVLPADDTYIKLSGPTGPIFQGSGSGKYAINRVSTPNEIILESTPITPINLYLEFWI